MKQIKLYTTTDVNEDFGHTSKWVKAEDYYELFRQFWEMQEKLILVDLSNGNIVRGHIE